MSNADSLLVDNLKRHIDYIEKQVMDLHTQIAESQNNISNAIAASDRYLNVASIVITIIAVGLGIYITWCQHRVDKIKNIVEDKEKDILRLKNEVENTNSQIKGDLTSLYQKLRREETLTILNRLVEVPEDITNVSQQLLSRDLLQEDYPILRTAFGKIQDDNGIDDYIMLFFQHFAGFSIQDEVLRKHFIGNFQYIIPNCFKKDIQKSTEDMVSVMGDLPPEGRMNIIIPFYRVFKDSKFKDMYNIVALLKSTLSEEQWNSVIAQTAEGTEIGEEI